MIPALGYHVILDLYGVDPPTLENYRLLIRKFSEILKRNGVKVLSYEYHRFNPQGISIIFILESSHVSIHTWPENEYLSIDIYVCDTNLDLDKIKDEIIEFLKPKEYTLYFLNRGIIEKIERMNNKLQSNYEEKIS